MNTVVAISAEAEWEVVRERFPRAGVQRSPFGEWLAAPPARDGTGEPAVFFQGGWGKIAAAASTQYAIDRWAPRLLINLGTCGGIAGRIARGTIVLAERTLVYDVIEQMSDADAAIAHYATHLDLSWLRGAPPRPVWRGLLVSADRDLVAGEVDQLVERFDAVAGDWESGAIAWTAARNGVRCLILRGVSDLVDSDGGEAYGGNIAAFHAGARAVMGELLDALPDWIRAAA